MDFFIQWFLAPLLALMVGAGATYWYLRPWEKEDGSKPKDN